MKRYDNYPDDIRMYDNDPRSPFYDDSEEVSRESWIQNKKDEIAFNWLEMDEAMAEHESLRENFMIHMANAFKHYSGSPEYADEMAQAWRYWDEIAEAEAEARFKCWNTC